QGALLGQLRVEDGALEHRLVAVPHGLEAVAEGVPRILEEVVRRRLGLGVGGGDQDAADEHRGQERQQRHHQRVGVREPAQPPARRRGFVMLEQQLLRVDRGVAGRVAHETSWAWSPVVPAISRPISAGSAPPDISPMIRPRYMTPIRSARPSTSSSSVDTTITAAPLSRSATIRLCTNSMEPTSRPRVGWATISTLSGRDSSRASTTFCWLPPDRVEAECSIEDVRTSNSSTRSSAFWRMRSRSRDMPWENGSRW